MKTTNPIGQYRVNVGDIEQSINALETMEDLNKVISCLKQKQKSLRAELVAGLRTDLKVGDTVGVNSKNKVLTGEIIKINRTKCVVKINDILYNVPISIIETKYVDILGGQK